MNTGEKINEILETEKINLKEFSDLTGIAYNSLLRYRNNRLDISVKQINKISSVPRFSKYRNLLLSIDQPIEDVIPGSQNAYTPSAQVHEARQLLEQLESAGRLEEATEIMKTLIKRAEKQ